MTKHIKKLTFYTLKQSELRSFLAKAPLEFTQSAKPLALQMPLPNGKIETFMMVESPILAPAIAAKHPEIKTYSGKSSTDPTHTIRISFTAQGFNAIILGVENDAAYYDKVSTNPKDQVYRVYFARDAERPKPTKSTGQTNKCGTIDNPLNLNLSTPKANSGARLAAGPNDVGTSLRTFRLAFAATGEFTQQAIYGGDVNAAFNGLVGYVNRVNAIYRRELSVALQLVSDVSLVYSNTATDPYTNSNQDSLLVENQRNLDNVIGNTNYDIGHILGFEGSSGGGLASGSSVCDNDFKAQGVSGVGDGSFAPIFDDQLVAHEMGHQFGMSHSYNSIIPVCTTRAPETSVEPGAGATIMSYGFTCGDSDNDDNYEQPAYAPFLNFHTVSYDQAINYIKTISCFTTTSTGNVVPVINSISTNRTIPKSTPFSLSGVAGDANAGDVLSYSWEGTNIGTETPTASTLLDPTKAPFFRSYEPISTGVRTFPRLMSILDGSNTARGDKLPSVGVVTTHRLTVRDNAGGVTYGAVTVTVAGNSGPFLETTNLDGSYPGSSEQTITWSVNNTTAPPVNCANVNILLSTDGGLTFPIVLAANTPNDGSQTVALPAVLSSMARIKVAASNNIFFDISNTDFSITAPVGVPIVGISAPDSIAIEGATGPDSPNGGRRAAASRNGRVAADDDEEEEEDLTGFAYFHFERTSGDGKLTVRFEITGSFADDSGLFIADTVSFEDGEVAFDLYVIPGEDDADEGDEDLILTLIDEADYDVLESSNAAKIIIKDNDTALFSIMGVTTVNCVPVSGDANRLALTFTPQYSGASGQPISFSVVNELAPTTNPGPYSLSLYADNPIITLKAMQNGTPGEASFAYNWLAACNGTTPTPTSPFAITGVTTVSCVPIAGDANRRSLTFTPQYRGASGQPISFSVVNELAPTTNPGPYTLGIYTDQPTITLKATQIGTTGEATFIYNWLAACNGTTPTPTSPFAITGVTTVSCTPVLGDANRRSLTFTPQYRGASGQPISFSVVNELLPTTAPGPYTLGIYTDQPTITLKATQTGTTGEASFVYNWLAVCGTNNVQSKVARESGAENSLLVRVLGNPVANGQVRVEISGATGKLQLTVTDLRGTIISARSVEQPATLETHNFDIGRQSVGAMLLRVTTPTQAKTVKLLKAE